MENNTGNVETLDSVLFLLGIPSGVSVVDNSKLPSLVYVVGIDDLSLESYRSLVSFVMICRGKNGNLNLCACSIDREVVDTGEGINGSDDGVTVIILGNVTLAINLGKLYVLSVFLNIEGDNRVEVLKLYNIELLVENREERLKLKLVFVTDNVGLITDCKFTGEAGRTVCGFACSGICTLKSSNANGLLKITK